MFLSRRQQEKLLVDRYQAEVDPLLEWGCEKVGMENTLSNITVEFSHRMRTTMGRAQTDFDSQGGRITLCLKLFVRATEAERRRTILHELAHILANLNAGRHVGHSWEWKRMMIRLGLSPERCHKVNTDGIKRRNRRFTIRCESGCALTVTSSKRTRMKKDMQRGARFWCPRCGIKAPITLYALDVAQEVRPSPA